VKTNLQILISSRIQHGFSQRELAKATGISSSLISLIEKGERNPSPNTAKKICVALDKKFEEIFFTQSVNKSERSA
jgi:putative transcriptional regulator